MMKTIVFFIGLMFCAAYSWAQTNYYTTTKTFYETGYTYQCDVIESGDVTLYNKSNKWTYVNQIDRKRKDVYVVPEYDYIPLFERDTWTRVKRFSIVNNAFPVEMKQWVKGRDLIITMYINSKTGRVDEVVFRFVNFFSYAMIPVWVYRKIEEDLKSQIWYRPTQEGKRLNYILLWWGQEPE